MKNTTLLFFLFYCTTNLFPQNSWLLSTDSSPDFVNKSHQFYDAAVSPNGYYLLGEYWRHIAFENGDLVSIESNDESQNSFVVEVDENGQQLQFFDIRGLGYQRATNIEVASDGTLWIGGFFRENFTYQDTSISAQTFNDSFLMQLSPTGELMQLHHYHANNEFDSVSFGDLSLTQDGNIWIALNFYGEFSFNGNTYTSGIWNGDALVMLLTPQGEILQSHYINSMDDGEGAQFGVGHLTLDAEDNLFLAGTLGDSISIDGNIGFANTVPTERAWIAKFDENGEISWAQMIDGGSTYPGAFAFDEQDRLYAAFQFFNYITIDGTAYGGSGSYGETAVVRFSKTGQPEWTKTFTRKTYCGTCGVYPRHLILKDDQVVLGGFFDGEMEHEEEVILGNNALPQTAYLLTMNRNGEIGDSDSRLIMLANSYSRLNFLKSTPAGYLYGGEFYNNISVQEQSTNASAAALFYGLIAPGQLVTSEEIEPSASLSLFPNPSYSSLEIVNLPSGNYSYQITNPLGQIIRQNTFNTENKIEITGISKGLYYLHVQSSNGRNLSTLPFVKS